MTKHASVLPLLDLESEIMERYLTHGYKHLFHMDTNDFTHGCKHTHACVLAPNDLFNVTA